MQIRSITVNATGLAQERGGQGNIPQVQTEKNEFDPECRMTISREGKNLSHQQTTRQTEKRTQDTQNVEAGNMLTGYQEEYVGLEKTIEDMFKKVGYRGDEIRERTERFYEVFSSSNPFRGGIRQFVVEDWDKIFKRLTPADLANATPFTFDDVAALSHMPENESPG